MTNLKGVPIDYSSGKLREVILCHLNVFLMEILPSAVLLRNLKNNRQEFFSGAQLDARNEGGVLASASKHQELLQKLSNLGDL